MNNWWDDFEKRAVTFPVKGKITAYAAFYQVPDYEDQALVVNASVYNDLLSKVGA